MLKLLNKTIGLAFFAQHTGLFLVIGYLVFGAVEGSQLISYQYALVMAICSSPIIWLVVFLLWLAYSVKCYLFVNQKLDLPAHSFITSITKIKRNHQLLVWLKVYVFMLSPILLYSILILVVSLRNHYFFSFFATLIGLITLLVSLAFLTFRSTNYTINPKKNLFPRQLITVKKPFWAWPLFYLLNEQPLMFFACKLVSLFAFKSILWVFADVGDDIRVFLTAMLAVVLSHAVVVLNWVKFDATYLSFVRSLRITTFKRLGYWLMISLILLIPEFGLVAWLTHFNVLEIGLAVVFGMATLFSLITLVYLLKADMDRYIKYLLFFFFITMLAILAGFSLLFSVSLLLLSMLIFVTHYPKIDLKDLA